MVRPLLSNLKVSCFCIISTFIFPRVSLERETEKAKLLFLLSFKYQMINRSVKNLVFLVPDADHNYILLIMTFDVKYLQSIVKWIDFKWLRTHISIYVQPQCPQCAVSGACGRIRRWSEGITRSSLYCQICQKLKKYGHQYVSRNFKKGSNEVGSKPVPLHPGCVLVFKKPGNSFLSKKKGKQCVGINLDKLAVVILY